MSTGRQQNITKAFANKEHDDSSQEARPLKRRRDDDADLTSNRSSCVLPSKNETARGDLQEESFRFDSIRSTETPIAENIANAPPHSVATVLPESFRFQANEPSTLESLQRLIELPRFVNVPAQLSLLQSLCPSLNSNSFSSLPMFNIPLNQYQRVQDLSRAPHVYDEASSLGALLPSHRGNRIANPLDDNLLEARLTSLAHMHFINNSVESFPVRDTASLLSLSRNSEVNGSFLLSQSLRSAQALSTVSDPRTEGSLQSQIQSNTGHKAVSLTLYIPDDDGKLSENQIFLRQNIELFRATELDILSLTRGKNKPIVMNQVGIRCCHCKHVPVGRRKKGSTYFPSTLMGLYQAAQNLSVEHLQSGLCNELPPDVRERFSGFASGKKCGVSGAGKKYWAEAGRTLGLVDTDDGIRFARDRLDDRQTREYVEQRPATDGQSWARPR